LGLGAASGLHIIVIFPPSAAYVSNSRGRFLNEGFNARTHKTNKSKNCMPNYI
jgi:hypothetical protein